MKEQIIAYAQEIGIDKIGFCGAEPFEGLAERLQHQQDLGYQSGFEHPIIEDRVDPARLMDQPQSIIAIALAYPTRAQRPQTTNGVRGAFARASWGIDYHHILQEKMDMLMQYIEQLALEQQVSEPTMTAMVDTGELVDVTVAQRAGLGFIGRNGLLITPEFGSYVYLGEIITNLPLPPDPPYEGDCGDCHRCIQACPTGALLGDGSMNAQRCLSYQTQTKTLMPYEFRQKMGRVIYGCDICQLVCPYNRGIDYHHHPAMEPDPEATFPELQSMVQLTNREFKDRFGHMAGSWRGKKPLQRNAIIGLGNAREVSAIPTLLACIEQDPRPVIRATSAWAIAQILGESANSEVLTFVRRAFEEETDSEARQEYAHALATMGAMPC